MRLVEEMQRGGSFEERTVHLRHEGTDGQGWADSLLKLELLVGDSVSKASEPGLPARPAAAHTTRNRLRKPDRLGALGHQVKFYSGSFSDQVHARPVT